jgi:hypothetical protein
VMHWPHIGRRIDCAGNPTIIWTKRKQELCMNTAL